ncbi:hypothetical protein TURU_150121 [Turdus rufiventris]|nr:hypothetical protein TURU_150121 [Turdus rufiventris]
MQRNCLGIGQWALFHIMKQSRKEDEKEDIQFEDDMQNTLLFCKIAKMTIDFEELQKHHDEPSQLSHPVFTEDLFQLSGHLHGPALGHLQQVHDVLMPGFQS